MVEAYSYSFYFYPLLSEGPYSGGSPARTGALVQGTKSYQTDPLQGEPYSGGTPYSGGKSCPDRGPYSGHEVLSDGSISWRPLRGGAPLAEGTGPCYAADSFGRLRVHGDGS